MKKLKILFIVVFSAFGSYAQNVAQVIAFADSLYAEGNFITAGMEYQRAAYFNSSSDNADLYFKMGKCFQSSGEFAQAIKFYDFSLSIQENDSLKREALFCKITSCLQIGNYILALSELSDPIIDTDEQSSGRKEFYIGVSYFGMELFEKASEHFVACLDTGETEKADQITKIMTNKRKLYKPDPDLALVLSLLVPGLGQVYAGDVKNGLNSVVLVGSLVFLGYRVAYMYTVLDSFLTIYPWFQRYYTGGFKNAKKIAFLKRTLKRNMVFQEILIIIGEDTRNLP